MINHEHKFIFIHIPKTGGTSLAKALDPTFPMNSNSKHRDAMYFKEKCPEKFSSYFKFSLVRNPWARAVSYFHFKKRRKRLAHDMTFSEFCNILINGKDSPRVRDGNFFLHGRESLDFLLDEDGNSTMEFIGTLENFQADFDIVCDKLGIPRKEVPHTFKTNHKHYTEYYDDETRQIVAEKYKKDIEYFGYEFGE
jgi:chondroitin 4-sulfotransferase 11